MNARGLDRREGQIGNSPVEAVFAVLRQAGVYSELVVARARDDRRLADVEPEVLSAQPNGDGDGAERRVDRAAGSRRDQCEWKGAGESAVKLVCLDDELAVEDHRPDGGRRRRGLIERQHRIGGVCP